MFRDLSKINAIIFDLGGVIINIDYKRTSKRFQELGVNDFDTHFSQFKQDKIFESLEKGLLKPTEFYSKMREIIPMKVSDETIRDCWNDMLLDIPPERLQLLEKLKRSYKLLLLSNTNQIHLESFNQYIQNTYHQPNLSYWFDKCYYSHEINMRKPDKEIFLHVLHEQELMPQEVLFLDDTFIHLDAAKELGIATCLISSENSINTLF